MEKSVSGVRQFWDQDPLWTGESKFEPGSVEFFAEHRNTVIKDCFAAVLDPRTLPPIESRDRVLGLGCGIGFWTTELCWLVCEDVTGADLSPNSRNNVLKSMGLEPNSKRKMRRNYPFRTMYFRMSIVKA